MKLGLANDEELILAPGETVPALLGAAGAWIVVGAPASAPDSVTVRYNASGAVKTLPGNSAKGYAASGLLPRAADGYELVYQKKHTSGAGAVSFSFYTRTAATSPPPPPPPGTSPPPPPGSPPPPPGSPPPPPAKFELPEKLFGYPTKVVLAAGAILLLLMGRGGR